MWIFDYLPKELGFELHREPIQREYYGNKFFIGHGDGLGPGDKGYKMLKKIFASKICQWAFARLHPNFGIWLADKSSKTSRAKSKGQDEVFHGEDREWLIQFCREKLKSEHFDYFVFGHRHLPIDFELSDSSRYFNLGEWINYSTYLEVGPNEVALKEWE
jgi:UDP-2,3-diacylglucosamine hydrolase